MPRHATDVCFMGARDLARLVRTRELSAREVMAAHLERIAQINPRLNAIVSKLDDEQCLALADEADRQLARRETLGPLHGLPTAFKDLEPAVGFPQTCGSPIYADFLPADDSVLVARLRRAGAIGIGKTNVPEFGMGSHTYNAVFGTTRNAYDRTRSAGGSSGGAAAAIAAGLLPCADGSDLGGSLRNPASFNNIVALRPTVGLVPVSPDVPPHLGFLVKGPMARSVTDAAWLLGVMAGPDAGDPFSYTHDVSGLAAPLDRAWTNARVAWCPDLGGLPVDPAVSAIVSAARPAFDAIGCDVHDACPDLSGADEVFLTLRRWRSWHRYGDLLARHRHQMKPEAVEEIERGATIRDEEVAAAWAVHEALVARVGQFQQRFPFFVCVVSQVPPFDASLPWPQEIAGVRMTHYIQWMQSTYWISITRCPAVSVPAGFTRDGLPVGVQIVGRPRDDLGVLQLAYAFEQETRVGLRRP